MLAIGLSFLSLYGKEDGKTTVPSALVPRLCPEQYPMIEGQADCDNCDGQSDFIYTGQVLANETLCTCIFVSVILMVKIPEDKIKVTKDNVSGALAVALTLLCVVKAGGRLGACYNPAVAVCLTLNSVLYLDNTEHYLSHYFKTYFIGPFLGAIIAGFFHLIHKIVLKKGLEEEAQRPDNPNFSHDFKQGLIEDG